MPRVLRAVLFVLAIDFSFFVLATAALRSLGAGAAGLPIASWCGWLALAWLLGYVMPGAPAGVGVRETVLVIGLGPALGEADALVLALAYRFVTVMPRLVFCCTWFTPGKRISTGSSTVEMLRPSVLRMFSAV